MARKQLSCWGLGLFLATGMQAHSPAQPPKRAYGNYENTEAPPPEAESTFPPSRMRASSERSGSQDVDAADDELDGPQSPKTPTYERWKSKWSWSPGVPGMPGYSEQVPQPLPSLERYGLPPGWFAALDLTPVTAHVSRGVTSEGLLPVPVAIPVADQNWTVMPRLEVGYRSPEGIGEYVIGLRGFATTGSNTAGGIVVDSRLTNYVLDLEKRWSEQVAGLPPMFGQNYTFMMGVRATDMDFTTHSVTAGEQYIRNRFIGAGPRTGLDVRWLMGDSGWQLFSHGDASGMIGEDAASFRQMATGTQVEVTTTVAAVNLQSGLSWVPNNCDNRFRFSTGYQWERWFWVGPTARGRAEITIQGPFVRGEWKF